MFKSVLLFICFSSVFSLQCYTTDPSVVLFSNVTDSNDKLQDCRLYLDSILRQQTTVSRVPLDVVFHCFTITIHWDKNATLIKGCVPANTCNLIKDSFAAHRVASGVVRRVACDECSADACNTSPSTRMFVN